MLRIETPTGNVKIFGIDLDADEAAVLSGGGNTGCSRSHVRITNDLSLAAEPDAPFHDRYGLLKWMSAAGVGLKARLHCSRATSKGLFHHVDAAPF